jgi:hypothetical protein
VFTVEFSGDEPVSVTWDKGFDATSLGPGTLVVPGLKATAECPDAQIILQISSYEDVFNDMVLSMWDTVDKYFFSAAVYPAMPLTWDGEQDVVFLAAVNKAKYSFRAYLMGNGLAALVKAADGAYVTFTKAG